MRPDSRRYKRYFFKEKVQVVSKRQTCVFVQLCLCQPVSQHQCLKNDQNETFSVVENHSLPSSHIWHQCKQAIVIVEEERKIVLKSEVLDYLAEVI